MIIFPNNKSLKEVLEEKPCFGVSTGIPELDESILGLRPGLIMIAAYSGIGKSSLMADITIAASKEVPVAVFSLEMGNRLFVERMIYNFADLNYHRGISGDLSAGDKESLKTAQENIEKLNDIYVNESSNSCFPSWILKQEDKPENSLELAIENYYEKGCRVFLIDYIQYVDWGFRCESETLRLKHIVNHLHDLTIRLQVPIITFAQLKKEVADKKRDPTPSLSDVRDSGYLISESDVFLFLHRPEYFDVKREIDLFSNHVEDAQIIIAKQRNGPTGKIDIKFHAYAMSWKGYKTGEEI